MTFRNSNGHPVFRTPRLRDHTFRPGPQTERVVVRRRAARASDSPAPGSTRKLGAPRVVVADPAQLGFRDATDMVEQLVKKEAEEQAFRRARIAAQQQALKRPRDFLMNDLADITSNEHAQDQAI